jgi:DNA (cytosine-5)-methyltransferase 1
MVIGYPPFRRRRRNLTRHMADKPDNEAFYRTTSLKVGDNDGTPRIWLDGKWVLDAGFIPDSTIAVEYGDGEITVRLDPDGKRTVTPKAKGKKSVIDLNNEKLKEAVGEAKRVKVVAKAGEILITPERTERKRLTRTRTRTEGALFAGGGMLSEAARQAGYKPTFAVEIDPYYADIYQRNHPESRVFNQSVSEVDLDDLPRVGLLTMGIPCEPYSRARTVARGSAEKRDRTEAPEAHELGDMVFWALRVTDHLNPDIVVIEEAPAFLHSGAGWILRHALSRMGYHVGAGVMDPRNYGRLTGRKRSVVIARSGAPVVWPQEIQPVETVDDILNPEEHPDNAWFSFAKGEKQWLKDHWERQTAKGNGFASEIIRPGATSVGTIKKRYFAGQGDNPVVAHPTEADTYRWLTLGEVRRLHGVPDDYYLGDATTRAGEVMGQGVDIPFFRLVIEAAARGNDPKINEHIAEISKQVERQATRERLLKGLEPDAPAKKKDDPETPQLRLF